jgi:hypothetical protein
MRKRRGSVTAEIAVGLIALIPVFILFFDLIIVFAGYQTNQNYSRDAARAASLLQPLNNGAQSEGAIFQRAEQICANGRDTLGGYFEGPFLERVNVDGYVAPGPFGGPYSGTVQVETRLTVKVPASIPGLIPASIELRGVSTFPCTGTAQSTIVVQ